VYACKKGGLAICLGIVSLKLRTCNTQQTHGCNVIILLLPLCLFVRKWLSITLLKNYVFNLQEK